MRIEPNEKYIGLPCSYVATGTAYEDVHGKEFAKPMIDNLRSDGYSSLENTNKYIRKFLPIRKKVYFKRNERIKLAEFLTSNETRCIVCVYGHLIYVNSKNYWSFFENEADDIVCIWYLKNIK